MAGIDKITRILIMYTQLIMGGRIHKNSFCVETEIDRRTFDRDIEDIRLFLSESYSGKELVYDRYKESYYLEGNYQQKALSGMEITMLLESVRASGCMRKDEYTGLIESLIKTGEVNKRRILQAIGKNYIQNYHEEANKEAIMKMQWDLQQCIAERDMIKLRFVNETRKVISPVELKLYWKNLYLFAYCENGELEVYPINKIEAFQVIGKKFNERLFYEYSKIKEEEKENKLQKERKKHEEN